MVKAGRIVGYTLLTPLGIAVGGAIFAAGGSTIANNISFYSNNKLKKIGYTTALMLVVGMSAGIALASPIMLVKTIVNP